MSAALAAARAARRVPAELPDDPVLRRRALAVPERYRKLYVRSITGKSAPREAIKAKCLDCCGWERHEGKVDRIGACTVRGCSLWPLRPFQDAQESAQVVQGAIKHEGLAGDGSGLVPLTVGP